MEDYNTATLPHVKFYDMTAWHAKETARAAKEGGAAPKARPGRLAPPFAQPRNAPPTSEGGAFFMGPLAAALACLCPPASCPPRLSADCPCAGG